MTRLLVIARSRTVSQWAPVQAGSEHLAEAGRKRG
jgi:hypothetical protein